jgi:DNA-binding PadR family transcriptional regulator
VAPAHTSRRVEFRQRVRLPAEASQQRAEPSVRRQAIRSDLRGLAVRPENASNDLTWRRRRSELESAAAHAPASLWQWFTWQFLSVCIGYAMPKSDHLSDFELYVMLAVAALDDNAYGVTIADRIGDRTGREISIGAVYSTLGRLADKGLVSFSMSEAENVRGGRARKLVALTPAGVRATRQATDSLARMLDGVTVRPAPSGRR